MQFVRLLATILALLLSLGPSLAMGQEAEELPVLQEKLRVAIEAQGSSSRAALDAHAALAVHALRNGLPQLELDSRVAVAGIRDVLSPEDVWQRSKDRELAGWAAANAGELESGLTLVEEALELVKDQGHILQEARLLDLSSRLTANSGELEEAIPLGRASIERFKEAASFASQPGQSAAQFLRSLLIQAGNRDELKRLSEECIRVLEAELGKTHPLTCQQRRSCAYDLCSCSYFQEAIDLLTPGREALLEALEPGDPEIRKLNEVLSHAFQLNGEFDLDIELSRSFSQALADAYGPEDERAADAASEYGLSLLRVSRFNEANEVLIEVEQRIQDQGWSSGARVFATYNGLARIREFEANYEEAAQYHELALEGTIDTFGEEHSMVGVMHQNLALCQSWMGRHAEARKSFENAIEVLESALAATNPTIGLCWSNYGSVLESLGLAEEAQEAYRRGLALLTAGVGIDHPATLVAEGNLGLLLLSMDDYAGARPHLEHTLSVRRVRFGELNPEVATSYLSLAVLSDFEGNLGEAMRLYLKALEISLNVRGPQHPETFNIRVNIARHLRQTGRADEAMERLEEAREQLLSWVYPAHPYATQAEVEQLWVAFSRSDWDAARTLGSSARANTEQAVQRVRAAMSEGERIQTVEGQQDLIDGLLHIALNTRSAEDVAAAYSGVLSWKGSIAREQFHSREALFDRLDERRRGLIDDLYEVQRALSQRLYQPLSNVGPELDELREKRNRIERELLGDSPKYSVPTHRAVREVLDDGACLVDYVIHRPWIESNDRQEGQPLGSSWGEPRLLAFVLTPSEPDPTLHDLGPTDQVEAYVEAFLESLRGSRGIEPVEDTGPSINDQLREAIWDPLQEHVGDANLILLSPMGGLARLPFETLVTPSGGYLLETYSFAYLQDPASLLVGATPPVDQDQATLLAIGAVEFSTVNPQDGLARRSSRSNGMRRWSPLPATEGEVLEIGNIHAELYDPALSQLLLGPEASEENVKAALESAEYVHFATHGFFSPGGPPSVWRRTRDSTGSLRMEIGEEAGRLLDHHPGLLSGLVLAGANSGSGEGLAGGTDDGYLTAEEIAWLPLNARLVVLSACETGLGKDAAGEGLIGLRRAFQMAGSRTVISSLWSVEDRSTAELMLRFYEYLWLEGLPTLEALRQAKIDLLESNLMNTGYPRPQTWGAFILSGDWK